MIRAVIFDFDRTLTDMTSILEKMLPRLQQIFAPIIRTDISDKEMLDILCKFDQEYIVANKFQTLADGILNCGIFKDTENKDAFIPADWRTHFWVNFADAITPYDEAYDLLSSLRRQGYKLGILTNGSEHTQLMKLQNTELHQYMDEIVISGTLPHAKPHPSAFHTVCQRLGVSPQEAVFVGDHPIADISGAQNAGLTPVWLNYSKIWSDGVEPPTYTIQRLSELPSILQTIQENI